MLKQLFKVKAPFIRREGTGLVHPGEEKAVEITQYSLPVLKRGLISKKETDILHSDGTGENAFKLKEKRFRFDVRWKFFTLAQLPREAMSAPSLGAFKALGSLIW